MAMHCWCAIVLMLALALSSRTAAACSVGGFPNMSPSEAEIAFSATVESVRVPWLLRHCGNWPVSLWPVAWRWLPHEVVLQLRVENVWRGLQGDHVSLSFDGGCGFAAPGLVGQTLLFLEYSDADTRAGRFRAGPCYYPGLLKDHGAIAASLGTPHAPMRRPPTYVGLYVVGLSLVLGFVMLGAWSRQRVSRRRRALRAPS